MKITQFTKQNSRLYQEDRSFIKYLPNGEALLGVFDGHGGHWTSETAAIRTPDIFRTLPRQLKTDPEATLERLFEKLVQKTAEYFSGSTACIVWIKQNMAYVAVLGDSLTIIKTARNDIWVSPEHNVRTNKYEGDEAIQRGGYIEDGYLFDKEIYQGSGLQMSRALGDVTLARVLNRKPEIFSIPLNADSWILLCSDGLIDPSHENKDFMELLITTINTTDATAKELVLLGATKQRDDNSTAILVRV